jgi:hypothetical protein
MDDRLPTWPNRLYRALLIAYPPEFRADYGHEMRTLFRDQLHAAQRQGPGGVVRHLWRTILDLLTSALAERSALLQTKKLAPLAIGAALLVVPLTFFAIVILTEYLGVPVTAEPFYTLYEAPTGSLTRTVLDVFIIFGPVAAVLINTVPFVRGVRQRMQSNGGLLVAVRETNALVLGVLLIGLALAAMFFTYALLENWQCIIGAALTC